jgi:hypothetical protein
VEIFGLKIYLAKQIFMKEKRRLKYLKVLAAGGRRQRRRKRGKKCMRLILFNQSEKICYQLLVPQVSIFPFLSPVWG